MSTNTAQLIPENPNETLDRQINETKRFVRDIDFFLSFFSLLTVLLAVLFLAVLADHWLFTDGLSMFLRVGVFFVLLFIIAFHVYRRIVPLLLYPINPVYVASLLEESRPSLKNSIVNWILLRKERFEQENHYNDKLAERIFDGVAKTAVSGVKGISSERAVDLRGLTRWGIALTLCFLFFVAYATFSPKSPLTSLTRIMLPISNIERPQAVRFLNIEPGNTVALQGEKLTVSAEVVGQSNEPVYLFFSTDDGQAVRQAIPMSLPEGKTRYEVLFPPGKQGFAGNVDYWIAQNDSRSGTFRIEVRPTASVEIVSLKYRFPPYTGLPDETLENSGDIRAIEGTEVKIGVRSTIPLQRIDLVFDNDPVKTVGMKLSDVNPLEATAAITLKLDPQNSNPTTIRNFSFRAIDQEGYESRRSGIFRLEVLPDQPPMVQWADTNTQLKDVAQLDLPLNSSLELPIQAEDRDFGLRYLRFHVESGNKQIRPAELLESPATGPTEHKGSIQRKAVFSPITSRLAEGDSAEIWAEAVDTKFPDPNNATTRRITVRIVAPQKQEQPPKENEKNSDDNKEKQNKEQDKEQNKDKNSDKNNDKEQNKNNEKEQQETKQQEQEKNQRSQDSADNREQNGRSNDKRSEKSENNKEEEDNSGEENNKENGKEQNKEKNSGKNGENNGENDERQKSEETQNGWNEGEQSKESDTQGNSNEPSREPSNTNENTSGNNNDKTENNNSIKDSAKNDDDKENSEQENENPSSKDNRQNGVSKKAINPETQDGDAMEEILKQMKKEGKFDDKKLDNRTNNEQNANKQTGNDQKDNNQNRSQQKNNDPSSKQTESKQAESTPDSKPEPRDQKEQNPEKQGSEKQDESGLGQENSQPNEANQTDTKNTEQTNAGNKEQSSGQSSQKDNSKSENSGDQQSNDSASEFSKKQGNDRKSGDQTQDVPVDSADNAPRQRDDSLDPNSKERSNQGGNSDNPQKSNANTPNNSASGGDEGKTQTGQQEQSNQQTQSSEQGKTVDKNENGIEKQNGSQEKGTENKQAGDNQNGDNQNGNNQSGEKQNGNNQSGNNQKGEKQNSTTKSGQSDENKSGAGQSKELNSGESGNSNESGSDQSDFNQSDLPKGENSAAGKNQKNQSGKPSPDSTSNTSPTGGQGSSALNIETLPEDANLEYTKKITNLVLEYLEDQLKTKPNQELLDNLGWTEKDLRDFHRKWQEMSEQSKHPESNTANDDAQWKEAFKSLGLKPSQDRQQLQKSRTEVQDKNKVTESQRFTPPSAIKDRFKRYTEGIGK
ncbi:MAG: hypothetical protein LBL62_11410 [Planctomycetaceae bacterium]|jgi:hypothetical protein|nr:hypothetical protein [Planctomycetaceae bacterium]